MSELLSTGEMIDALKVGEVAKKQNADTYIKRVTKKMFMYCAENGDACGFREVTLDGILIDHKWHILPEYVSFEEAMKAHKEDKETITYHHDSELSYTFAHEIEPNQFQQIYYDSINLHEMLEGKWTIK